MWTGQFWKDAIERAVRTFVQASVALWAIAGVTHLEDVDWQKTASVGGFAAMLSLATSLAATSVPTRDDASLLPSPEDGS